MWHLNIFFSFFAQSVAFFFQGGQYILTDVFYEPGPCRSSKYHENQKTVTSLSLTYCAYQCFANPDCRRIMFDRKTKECSMYTSGGNCYHKNIEDKICYRLKSICSDVNCTRCPIGYYGDTCQHIVQDCSDGFNRGLGFDSMLSYIQPAANGSIIEAKCQFHRGGTTIFQHRDDKCLETDFNRTWDEYVNGFGKKHGEYWLGLRHIYDILQNHNNFELDVIVIVTGSGSLIGSCSSFNLTNSTDGYKFSCDQYKPNTQKPLGDSLTNGTNSIIGRPFSTYDQDYSNNNCPDRFMGGWWFLDDPICSRANPNGRRNGSNDDASIQWRENLGIRHDFSEVFLRLKRL